MDMLEEITLRINQLNHWTYLYDLGTPEISDAEWDKYYFQLAEMERQTGIYCANSPTQSVNYQVVNELKKVEHNHPMLSLDKTQDWNEFLNHFATGKDVIGMLKMDGLTCSLRYENGYLVSAETRGDGAVGEDILHNAMVVKSIPHRINYTDELIIDGEIICKKDDFEQFAQDYKNPRNFAAGSIRLLDAKECATRNLTFVVWNIVKGFEDTNSFIEKLNRSEQLGFTAVPWTSSFDWDAKEFLQEQAETLHYPIDGLVGRYDDIAYGTSLGATAHHTNSAYAFKFEDEQYTTELEDIIWQVGRGDALTPVALFKAIDIDSTEVSRASLHNLSVTQELFHNILGWVGQKITVAKANMIIPQIIETEEWNESIESQCNYIEIPETCPICGGDLEVKISDAGIKNLCCTNPDCAGKIINRIEHTFGKKGLDCRGISKATFEKLIEWGWIDSPVDVFNLSQYRSEWINKPGFGVKSVDKMLAAIEDCKHTDLVSFISALGIPLIGKTVAKEIIKYAPTWDDFMDKVDRRYDWSEIYGFAEAKSTAINEFNYEIAKRIAPLMVFSNESVANEPANEQNCAGLIICITGKLNNFKNRADLQNLIEATGGKVSSSVSGKTSILVMNDVNSTTSKAVTARSKGIPIMTEEEFCRKYLNI